MMSRRSLLTGKLLVQQLVQSRPCAHQNHVKLFAQVCSYSSIVLNRISNNALQKQISASASPSFVVLQCSQRGKSHEATVKDLKPKTKEEERQEKLKSKKSEPPSILLVDEKNSMSTVTLEDAGKLAKKRGLFLIEADGHSEGVKSGKQVYKLVSKSQFYGEDWKTKKEDASTDSKGKKAKDEKTILLKSKTNEHDIEIKTKSVVKMVDKGHTVRVLIGQAGDQNQNPESVYQIMENLLKDEPVRIVQKVVKNSQIRFQVMPPKATSAKPGGPSKGTKEKDKKESEDEVS